MLKEKKKSILPQVYRAGVWGWAGTVYTVNPTPFNQTHVGERLYKLHLNNSASTPHSHNTGISQTIKN